MEPKPNVTADVIHGNSGGAGRAAMSDSARWTLILAEIAACYALMYVSAGYNWPYHLYFRFFTLLPLYQAGVAFGFIGGTLGSGVIILLYVPLLKLDPLIAGDSLGLAGAAVMIVTIVIFGVFVGGIIGNSRRTRNYVATLSRISMNIARETDERSVMMRLPREALTLVDGGFAAVLVRDGDTPSGEPRWAMFGDHGRGPAEITGFGTDHPLLWAVREKAALGSNGVASDPRFTSRPRDGSLNSIIVAPVFTEEKVYGALLVADKSSGGNFTENDLSMSRFLTAAAAEIVHNLEKERDRQEKLLRKDQMKELFSRFVSSSVADYVLENPDLLRGRWQEVTLLVSDIRDYTTLAESLPPRDVVEQLNEYFTRMVDVVFDCKGTIDKFIGDCVIAYWGAPAPDPEHSANAARAALQMAEALDMLNREWAAAGRTGFNSGIALHTGKVLMGNVGDDRKKAFTVLGREVRNALALESLSKTYGEKIIVSAATAASLGTRFPLAKLPAHEKNTLGDVYKLERNRL